MDEYDESFYSVDQLLLEHGLVASSTPQERQSQFQVGNGKDLTQKQKDIILFTLYEMQVGGKVPFGGLTKVANQFGVHKSTVGRLWEAAKHAMCRGEVPDVRNKKKGKSGRHQTYENSEDWLASVPLNLRGTVRSYAHALNVSHSHIHRLIKSGKLRAHTSANHPNVSEVNKIQRMKWVLAHIEPPYGGQKPRFVDMQRTVHIDEKWFFFNPGTRRFYMLPKEADPYRSTKNKNFSVKVMFMGVTCRPVYDNLGNCLFDGKLGLFPFVYQERAKRNSKNRSAGTLETKVCTHVNQGVTRQMLIEHVLPCIRQKWPEWMPKEVVIQQDNAKAHISDNDPLFREEASKEGFNIHLVNQPPQSPDFNVLDLALFRALQSLQNLTFPKDIDDLIVKVKEAHENFSPILMRYAWVTLQYCMVEALKDRGGNNYKIPHINKHRLERLGILPEQLEVEDEIIQEAIEYLNNIEYENSGPHEDMVEGEEIEI